MVYDRVTGFKTFLRPGEVRKYTLKSYFMMTAIKEIRHFFELPV